MAHLTINVQHGAAPACCGLCGGRMAEAAGPRLSLAETSAVVCRDCGKKHAPSLVALLDLARVAERVGKIGRHTLVPPLTVMIDLVQAAEDYSHSRLAPARRQRVA
jgi:hypothetical protein